MLIDGKQSDRKFLGGVSGSQSIVIAQNDDNTLAHDIPLLQRVQFVFVFLEKPFLKNNYSF